LRTIDHLLLGFVAWVEDERRESEDAPVSHLAQRLGSQQMRGGRPQRGQRLAVGSARIASRSSLLVSPVYLAKRSGKGRPVRCS